MKILFLSGFIINCVFAASYEWQLKTLPDKTGVKNQKTPPKTVIHFKNPISPEKIYLPSKSPFGMGAYQKISINKRDLFFTYWPNGARAQLLRVFEPQAQAEPLCEALTFASKSNIRMVNNKIEIEFFEDPQLNKNKTVSQWRPCP